MYIQDEVSHVIYQSDKEGKVWAREADGFFEGVKTKEGVMKRFELVVE